MQGRISSYSDLRQVGIGEQKKLCDAETGPLPLQRIVGADVQVHRADGQATNASDVAVDDLSNMPSRHAALRNAVLRGLGVKLMVENLARANESCRPRLNRGDTAAGRSK